MKRFLLVDDNVAFAENLAEILRDEGHDVTVVGSAADALVRLGQEKFDAMVTDMRMPVMNGAQLVHQLRKVDPGIPVIVATAYSGDEDLRVARAEGLLAIVPKPLPLDRLIELLTGARRDAAVALIEDDAVLSDNLSELLRSKGFTAVCAASVTETERLGGVRPFVGLVDLRVPGGGDGAALLKFRERFPDVPVLVMTGHADVVHPPGVEPLRVFNKPFQTDELFVEIERVYAHRNLAA